MIRKLTKKEAMNAVYGDIHCAASGCNRPAMYLDQIGSGEDNESEVYCAVCAQWVKDLDSEVDAAYKQGLKEGREVRKCRSKK